MLYKMAREEYKKMLALTKDQLKIGFLPVA